MPEDHKKHESDILASAGSEFAKSGMHEKAVTFYDKSLKINPDIATCISFCT